MTIKQKVYLDNNKILDVREILKRDMMCHFQDLFTTFSFAFSLEKDGDEILEELTKLLEILKEGKKQ